ncbi:ribosome silencing factor [Candidatus Poriferisodalis sp.]|uniref:ribosome silencing factor n=1 Tax=Candidatus Poriferisodalis sp. TaxID=3101277 RepID=UPI003B02605B
MSVASVPQASPADGAMHAPKPIAESLASVPPALVRAAVEGASEMSAERIVVLDVGDVLAITDWFVIASAPNVRRVRRIAEMMEEHVKAAGGEGPIRTEGLDEAQWVLLDFGEFVAHVFHESTREYYDLERLWSDVSRHEFS